MNARPGPGRAGDATEGAKRCTAIAGQRFPACLRLRQKRDFDRVYERRASVSDGRLVVYAAPNGLTYPRLGISVARRIGTAAVRNRWKRHVREAFRRGREQLPAGLDLIVVVRSSGNSDWAYVQQALSELAWRAAGRSERKDPLGRGPTARDP